MKGESPPLRGDGTFDLARKWWCDVTVISLDSPKSNQKVSKERFVFHERVLKDQRNLTKYALAFAGFVMHEYMTRDGTTFRASLRKAERYLGIARQNLAPARDLLVQRGHLIALTGKTGIKGQRNQAGLFAFGKGPGDGMSTKATSAVESKKERKESSKNITIKNLTTLKHEALSPNALSRHGDAPPRMLPLVSEGKSATKRMVEQPPIG